MRYSIPATNITTMYDGAPDRTELQSLRGMEDAAQRLTQRPAAIHLLYGHSSVYTGSLLIGSATNRPLVVIDGATRFNSYTLSHIAALLKIPPKLLLRRTYVTRSFTAFQTEAAITTKLPRFLHVTPGPLVVILGLLPTYYDEQIKPRESRQSLQRILRALREVTTKSIHVLIADVEVADAPPGKEMLFRLVCQSADVVIYLDQYGFTVQRTIPLPVNERSLRLWDATTTPLPSSSIGTGKPGANSAAP